jgi:hypothetical protein
VYWYRILYGNKNCHSKDLVEKFTGGHDIISPPVLNTIYYENIHFIVITDYQQPISP